MEEQFVNRQRSAADCRGKAERTHDGMTPSPKKNNKRGWYKLVIRKVRYLGEGAVEKSRKGKIVPCSS